MFTTSSIYPGGAGSAGCGLLVYPDKRSDLSPSSPSPTQTHTPATVGLAWLLARNDHQFV